MSNPEAEKEKELGNKAFASKDYTTALTHYTTAIKLDPTNHVYYSNRSASHGGLSNWSDASTDAKECIKLNPSFIKGYYRLATALMELKEYDVSIATIKQGLNVDPDNGQLTKLLRTVKAKRAGAKRAASSSSSSNTTSGGGAGTAAGAGGASFTPTTDKEVLDLQEQFLNTNREYQTVQASIHKAQREIKMSEITKSEIEKIPVETTNSKMYRGIGKMFMLSSREDIMGYLEESVREEKKREESLGCKAEYLERKMKSYKSNIMELTKGR